MKHFLLFVLCAVSLCGCVTQSTTYSQMIGNNPDMSGAKKQGWNFGSGNCEQCSMQLSK